MLIHDISRENIYIFVYPVLSHWPLIKKKEKKKRKSNYSVYLSVQLQIRLFHDSGMSMVNNRRGKMCRSFSSREVNYAKLNARGGANGHLKLSSLSVDGRH